MKLLEPARALINGKIALKHLIGVNKGILAGGDNVLPRAFVRHFINNRANDAEVTRLPIRTQNKVASQMIDLVLMIGFAWYCNFESQLRIASVSVTPFAL